MPVKVPASGPIPARILICGEAPDLDSERLGRPLVGKAGWLLDQLLSDVGISRAECFITNACKYRPPENKFDDKAHAWWTDKKNKAAKFGCRYESDGMFFNDQFHEGLAELEAEIQRVRPEVIVALGNAALWALTGEVGISQWRGSEMWWKGEARGLGRVPVIPTYHPSYVLRVWEWKAAVTQDLRARVVAKMGHPELREMPPYRFVYNGSAAKDYYRPLEHILALLAVGSLDLACDVETKGGRIACNGFAWSELDAVCVPLMHVDFSRVWDRSTEGELCHAMRRIMEHPNARLIGQNFNYDRQYFIRDPAFGFRPRLHYDTMIGQHLLYPGMPKDLAYQSSLYCKWHRFWKDEGKEIEIADEERWWWYNCRDNVATWEISQVTRRLLKQAKVIAEDA